MLTDDAVMCAFDHSSRDHACAALRLLVYAYARPDLSTSAMESALCPLADHLSCDVCKQSLADRVKQLIVQWSVVKVSPCRLSLLLLLSPEGLHSG